MEPYLPTVPGCRVFRGLRFYRDRAWSHQGVTTFGRAGHGMPLGGGNEGGNMLVGRHYENPARHLMGHPWVCAWKRPSAIPERAINAVLLSDSPFELYSYRT